MLHGLPFKIHALVLFYEAPGTSNFAKNFSYGMIESGQIGGK